MRKLVAGAGAVAAGLAATLAVASPASAAPRNEGAACIQAGLSTLKDLGLLQARPRRRSTTAPWLTRPPGRSSPPCPRAATFARPGGEASQDQPRTVRLVPLTPEA